VAGAGIPVVAVADAQKIKDWPITAQRNVQGFMELIYQLIADPKLLNAHAKTTPTKIQVTCRANTSLPPGRKTSEV